MMTCGDCTVAGEAASLFYAYMMELSASKPGWIWLQSVWCPSARSLGGN